MSRFIKFALNTSIVATSGFVAYAYPKIYQGEYLEKSPYDPSKLSIFGKITHTIIGTNDDPAQSRSIHLINPNKNEVVYDYYEKKIDSETTKKILAKYKTNEEILTQLQNGVFLGPTLWFHRFVLTPYFRDFNGANSNNRIAGFTRFEPELKKLNLEKLPKTKFFDFPVLPASKKDNYIWTGEQVEQTKSVFPTNTIIYGIFDFLNYGKRSNGGFFEFAFGGDLLVTSAVHRIDYYTIQDSNNEDNLVVRFTNASVLIPPKSPKFTDETKGLHELMTRTIVLDAIRGLTNSL